MATSSEANNEQTATLTTEHTLATIATAGAYQLKVDCNALTDDEELTIRAKIKVLSGGTTRTAREWTIRASDGLLNPVQISVIYPCTAGGLELVFTLEQNNGTGRAFPWEITDLGITLTDAATGTSAPADRTPGSEHTLATRTDGKTYQFVIDVNAITTTEDLEIRMKEKVRSVGTTRQLWHMAIDGTLASAEPIVVSPPVNALNELVVTIEETGGTERSYPWCLCALD